MESREFNELSEEFVMDSLQLCETINKYRQQERKDKVLQHCDLMKSIRKEIVENNKSLEKQINDSKNQVSSIKNNTEMSDEDFFEYQLPSFLPKHHDNHQ